MKRKKFRKIIIPVLLTVIVLLLAGEFYSGIEIEENYRLKSSPETLEIHFIDVGQGDSTLIFQDKHAMLVDGGDNLQGEKVVDYLKYLGVSHLEYIIATHPDVDHIGGLDTVLESISCSQFFMPEYERDTKSYLGMMDALEENRVNIVSPKPGEIYTLGDAEFKIIAPISKHDKVNDNSIVFRLLFGENSFLFMGDAESDSETEILKSDCELKSDVYKVSHHGSSGTNTKTFLQEVRPAYAVISCGEGNDFGHPHNGVLTRLRMLEVKVFRTDEQGTITAVSDGENITFHMPPSESWKPGN